MSLINNYKYYYEAVASVNQQNNLKEVLFFSSLIDNNKILKILDLGCAEGKLSVELVKKGHDVTASDISKNFLEKTLLLAEKNNVNIKTKECDIENSVGNPFGEEFDVIFLMDVLEHLKNPTQALINIRNFLKRDGLLIINTPNLADPLYLRRYILKPKSFIDFYKKENLWDLHLQIYDYIQLEKTLNFVGLKIFKIIPNYSLLRFKLLTPLAKILVKTFPFLSRNLLVKVKKVSPINIENQIDYWRKVIKT